MASTSSSALRSASLGALAGALLSVAYDRAWATLLVAPAALALARAASPIRRVNALSLAAFAAVFTLSSGRCLPGALSLHGDVGIVGAWGVLAALVVVEAVRFAVAGACVAGLARTLPPGVVVGSALLACEAVSPAPLRWAFAAPLARIGWASGAFAWLGAPAVAALVVTVFGVRSARREATAALVALVALVAGAAFGPYRETSRLRVAVLQEPEVTEPMAAARVELEAAKVLEGAAHAGASFAVRSEGVVPGVVSATSLGARLAAPLPVVVGAVIEGAPLPTNSLVVIAGGQIAARYDKTDLLPLSERMPSWLGSLRSSRYAPGRRSPVVALAGLSVELSVCYEGALPTRGEAALRVNAVDDSWFAGSRGGELHFLLARLRAAEGARSLVRASRTGISAVVDGRGQVVASLPGGIPEHAAFDVPVGAVTRSPAQRGQSVVTVASLVLLGWGLWLGRRRP